MGKNISVTQDQQADIDRLHVLLDKQGVDTHNPKHPGLYSDSALFRFLVEDKLKQLGETAKAGKQTK